MHTFNPILGELVVASVHHREKQTTTTKKSTKWPVHPLTPAPISAVGQQEFASGTLTNRFHICTHSEATLKYHNQTYDTEIHTSFED